MNNTLTLKERVLRDPVLLLAFGFGSGLAPKAPGTWGTLAAIPFFLLLNQLSASIYLLILLIATIAGIYLCGQAAERLGVHDHPGIVWDEFVGLWITLLWVPEGWIWIFAGFLLFRFFDILKPWPIKWVDQQVSGGWGIMFDDILAGVMALLVLQGLYYYLA